MSQATQDFNRLAQEAPSPHRYRRHVSTPRQSNSKPIQSILPLSQERNDKILDTHCCEILHASIYRPHVTHRSLKKILPCMGLEHTEHHRFTGRRKVLQHKRSDQFELEWYLRGNCGQVQFSRSLPLVSVRVTCSGTLQGSSLIRMQPSLR